jgi:hypothetical protein
MEAYMKKLFVLSLICLVSAVGCQLFGTIMPTAIAPTQFAAPATPFVPPPVATMTFSPTPIPPTSALPAVTQTSTPISAPPAAPLHVDLLSQNCTIDRSVKPMMYVNRFRLTWSDMSNNEDGFRIYRDGDLVAEVAANVTNVTDVVSRRNPRSYSYYVSAYNEFGESKSDIKLFTCGK